MRVIPVTGRVFRRMNFAAMAVGALLERENHWSEVMSNRYEFRDKRIRNADLVAIWALLVVLLTGAGLWSVL
jgi:hypothetical protein